MKMHLRNLHLGYRIQLTMANNWIMLVQMAKGDFVIMSRVQACNKVEGFASITWPIRTSQQVGENPFLFFL